MATKIEKQHVASFASPLASVVNTSDDIVIAESQVTKEFIMQKGISREEYETRREGGQTKYYLKWEINRTDRNDLVRSEEKQKKQTQMKARCILHDEKTGRAYHCPLTNRCNADCPYILNAKSGSDASYEEIVEAGHDFGTDVNDPARILNAKTALQEFITALTAYNPELVEYLVPVFVEKLKVAEIARRLHTTDKKAKNRKDKVEAFVKQYKAKHPDVIEF